MKAGIDICNPRGSRVEIRIECSISRLREIEADLVMLSLKHKITKGTQQLMRALTVLEVPRIKLMRRIR